MSSKRCTKCKEMKDHNLFPKDSNICNSCNNARNREAYANNPHAAQMSRDRVRRFRSKKKND